MDNKKEDAYFVRQIISNIDTIREYVKDMTYDDYISSQMVVDSTLFRLVQIGEEIKKLSPKFKFDNSEIAWGLILGFRNGIVHNYDHTDYSYVYEIITKNLNDLYAVCLNYINCL